MQRSTKRLLRAFRESEMMCHPRVELSRNRFAGSPIERELSQVPISQCRRRKWESPDHPGIESKEPTGCRYRPQHRYRADPGGIQPGGQRVRLQDTCNRCHITGVERDPLRLWLGRSARLP